MKKILYKNKIAILVIALFIAFGFIYRLIITSNGNFLFNMDNARDMVDVREMVVLYKLRLIGPTSGIEGLYTGPGWYYLLVVPFIVSGGDPYASIILENILWAIGGIYLFKIVQKWGYPSLLAVGSIWVASNFILLANVYALNPNPIIFLMPLFIYYLEKYLKEDKVKYSIITFVLAGLFFQFEMAFGLFMFPVIIAALLITKKKKRLLTRSFFVGIIVYSLFFLPQALFELRHNFLSTNAVLKHLSAPSALGETYNVISRFYKIKELFLGVFSATFMNSSWITNFFLLGSVLSLFLLKIKSDIKGNYYIFIATLLILIPFIGYIFVPINAYSWHLGGSMVAGILIFGFIIFMIKEVNRNISHLLAIGVTIFALINLNLPEKLQNTPKSSDQSTYANEIAAIDYVYHKAEGKNFKVYVYLPSVIDYPYQYLIWWYGIKQYGYVPSDYAYLPNKPKYISNKETFSIPIRKENSNLIFLIKEPDTNGYLISWLDNFEHLSHISTEKVGPLEIEIRKEE